MGRAGSLLPSTGIHAANSRGTGGPANPKPHSHHEYSHCRSHSRQGHLCPMTVDARDLKTLPTQLPFLDVTTKESRGQSPSLLQTSNPHQEPQQPDHNVCQTQLQVPPQSWERHSCSCSNSWMAQSTGHVLSLHGCKTTQWFPDCFKALA